MIIDPNYKVTTDNECIDIDIDIDISVDRDTCVQFALSLYILSLIVNNVLFWNSTFLQPPCSLNPSLKLPHLQKL